MKLNVYRCLGCGHYWQSDNDELPVKCPKCRSKKWNDIHKIVAVQNKQ